MGVLTLVRHGQASYMAEDYDRLSPTGEDQARKLGEFWVDRGIEFHQVFQGPAKRHARTAEIVAEVMNAAGMPLPEPVVIKELDEFDAFQVMKVMVPILIERDEAVRGMYERFQAAQDTPDAGRILQRLFGQVARHWSSGEFEIPEIESWAQFRSRICGAISHIRAVSPKSSNIAVFTSGGPIAATMSIALNLPPQQAIELVWMSRNCSYSEFLFSGDRFTLSSFNSFPHLDDRELLTYR